MCVAIMTDRQRMSTRRAASECGMIALFLFSLLPTIRAFGIEASATLMHQHAPLSPMPIIPVDSNSLHVSTHYSVTAGSKLLSQYTHLLKTFPLPTKMLTGATLATAGDAIAQARDVETPYSKKRSLSFAVFDAAYRCLQHAAFPMIIATCHGQYLASLIPTSVDQTTLSYFAAMEQTLASQLIIVPFIYYPVFFTLTAFIQNLSAEAALQRARDHFLPLMKRNLLFWIPMQFIQFEYVPTDLQIPFLSVCGLAWTCILSVAAGSTAKYNSDKASELGTDKAALAADDDLMEHLPEQVMAHLSEPLLDHLRDSNFHGNDLSESELTELTVAIQSEHAHKVQEQQMEELAMESHL